MSERRADDLGNIEEHYGTDPATAVAEPDAALPLLGRRIPGVARVALGYLIPVLLALAAGGAVVAATGGSAWQAYGALWSGAFGGTYQVSETLLRSIPLAFTGLAVAVAFRAGVWNIGAEGQLLIGALAVAALARGTAGWPAALLVPLFLVAGCAAGALWGGLAAFFKVRRGVPEVIATIMLNFLAINFVGALIHGPLMEKSRAYPETEALSDATMLPRLLPPTRLHAGLFLALIAAVVAGIWLFRTVHGYRLRVTGQNPRAAAAAGFDVPGIIRQAFWVSGALAGLGGAVELMGVTRTLSDSFSPGWGYTAIAVALLGGLQPAGVLLAALLFGALDAGASAMEAQAGVSHVVVQVVQGVIIFFVALRAAITARAARET
jgi:simple sugar transport system permease protein